MKCLPAVCKQLRYKLLFGGELYVLAKHYRMCKLANWSRPSNIKSCSHASGRATEEQAKQPNIHMLGVKHLIIL
jgi:hypothetical protein